MSEERIEIGIETARAQLGPLVNAVIHDGTDVILTRHRKPVARIVRYQEAPMTYTVEIQASNADRDIWQALAPAETVTEVGTAGEIAQMVALNQNVADGDNWRVCVWDGADADTGVEPAHIWEPPRLDLADLTRFLGEPDHQQEAVFSWSGETDRTKTWTEAEAAELAEIWKADTERIAAETA